MMMAVSNQGKGCIGSKARRGAVLPARSPYRAKAAKCEEGMRNGTGKSFIARSTRLAIVMMTLALE
jgi:hypothetical protein